MTLPDIESVGGGSRGVEATYSEMLGLASTYDDKALTMLEMAGLGARVMGNGDLLESALLSPLTFTAAESQVLVATTGLEGLTLRAAVLEADALAIRAVVGAFKASDELSHLVSEQIDYMVGRCLPGVLLSPVGLSAGAVTWAYYSTLSPEEQEAFLDDVSGLVEEHPALAQHLINGGGGLLESLVPVPGSGPVLGLANPNDGWTLNPTTNDASRLMALLLGNDTDFVHEFVDEEALSGGAGPRTPDDVEELIRQLAGTNGIQRGGEDLDGAIQIQHVRSGRNDRYIVYVPGTDDMSPIPGGGDTVRDMLGNYQEVAGMDSAYGRGIHQAMVDAGLQGKQVMLVGHSQGGMVSTALAADERFRADFDVKHVVTAGSPTAQVTDLPSGTQALHLENRGDVVPLLEGEGNPDQPHRTTVRFDDPGEGLVDNHSLDHYQRGAAAVDASDHGSIRSQIRQMHEDGFLGASSTLGLTTVVISRP